MSWTPTDEQVEKVARELNITLTGLPPLDAVTWAIREAEARAVLAAVGPMIAASALRDAAHMLGTSWAGIRKKASPGWLRNQADIIEKEAGR